MGCDIHLAVEVRKDGQWQRVLPPPAARVPWLVEQAADARHGDSWYQRRAEVTWTDERNYFVFAVLADVRNEFGVRPIAEPRGLPDDISDAVAALLESEESPLWNDSDIDLGDHSQSWLTLAELNAFEWPIPPWGDDDSEFKTRLIPALNALAEREGVSPDAVRIVFGFDS